VRPNSRILLAKLLVPAALLAAIIGCGPKYVKPAAGPVTFFLSADPDPRQLAIQATMVKDAKQRGPCFWMFCGDLFADARVAVLTDGEGQKAVLEAAGVDAVLLGPEWLEFGSDRLGRLLASARFDVLGANLLDTLSEPIGYRYSVKKLGSEAFGLVGLWLDSTDKRIGLDRSSWVAPEFAAARNLPLVRDRAALVGIAVRPQGGADGLGADFYLGAGSAKAPALARPEPGQIGRLELTVADGRVLDSRTSQVFTDGIEPDPAVASAYDAVIASIDSLSASPAASLKAKVSPQALERMLADEFAGSGYDGLVLDSPLANGAIGSLTLGELLTLLSEPGRPVAVVLTGREVKSLSDARVVWRKALSGKRINPDQKFRLVGTQAFYESRPELAGRATVLAEPLWQTVSRVLKSGR